MIKTITAGIAAAGIAVTAFAVPASASATPAPVNWVQRTCGAFAAYEKHPSPAGLVTFGTDSLRVPWKYLGKDAWQLVSDVRSGKTKYVSDSEQYVYEDCHNGYGL